MANVTYYEHIKPLFSQYDVVMMIGRFDLHSYEDVKQWANKLYLSLQPSGEPGGWSKLEGTHVMPKIPGPWPQEWVDVFKQWIDGGCLEGEPPYVPPVTPSDDVLKVFISLSEILTGFTGLGETPDQQQLARIYYNRLLTESQYGKTMDALLAAWSNISGDKDPDIAGQILKPFPLGKDIIILWYNSTTDYRPNPNALPYSYYGTPQFNQYKDGLVWKAVDAHPAAWAPENAPFYWRLQPTDEGQYTGQWIFRR